ncbi:GLPGLI family protein [Chryseobacterium lathyri]|jgi:GLPGLI family protein|uniref:GLPGLI family protein n=1 Tax=Chryseobacterium lathyri TaxID=395933 RepID=A0A511YBV5_9FLAO|nr:GLPGLI family protein [Chryseobacterium lathyri]GEN72676.1 hypothetical protein CLA01_27480 [Chryseobacterium lathyri]
MKKFLFLFSLTIFGYLVAQKQLHIQYLNVRSTVANVYEDLYTDGKNVLSKQDGNIMWTNPAFDKKKKGMDQYYISNLSTEERNFFFTTQLDNVGDYFVYDKVPQIKWLIDKETTKKILGYKCFKATSIFRGSPITAYFTEEIPYSVGPFKFFGLPGAILDVRVDDKNYDLWKAVKVDLYDATNIDFNPKFPEFRKINMEDFVKLKDKVYSSNQSTVPGSISKTVSVRLGVEKTFEWETQPPIR